MTKSEESLFACMQFCRVAALPEPWDKKSIFITAICKVKKNDLCSYYAYSERGKDGKPKIMRDFGPARAILEVEEYYPLLYLDSSYLKRFNKGVDGTQKLIEYLKMHGVELDYENIDRKELDKENIKIAIQQQLRDEKKKSKLIIKD